MRIQLPFCIPFEIVGHRPGYPIHGTGPAGADVPPTRSFLPVQIRRIPRPAWANPVADNAAVVDPVSPPEMPDVVAAGGAIARSTSDISDISGISNISNLSNLDITAHPSAISVAQIIASVTAEPTTIPSPETVAAGLQAVQEWVDRSPDNERHHRQDAALEFRCCWASTQTATVSLHFKGTLTSLPPMPPHVTCVTLLECGSLASLPDLSHCTQLKTLALAGCGSLTRIPDLRACSQLTTLHVEDCEGITTAGDFSSCRLLNDIEFIGCTSLTSLPSFSVHAALEELEISGCPSLQTPLHVAGCSQLQRLTLQHCDQVLSIDLSGCDEMRTVSLLHCASLAAIPPLAHMQRLSYMEIMNTAATSLPDDIVSLQNDCRIVLDVSRLSGAVRNRLDHIMNAPGYLGPRIEYGMGAAPLDQIARPLEAEIAAWHAEAPTRLQQALTGFDWSALGQHDNVNAFSIFLGRVRETNDYLRATPELKAATQARVAALLIQLQTDSALRENCLNLALDAVNTCGDRVAIRLMDMENLATTAAARAAIDAGHYDNNPQALIDLCKGQHRLAIVAAEADNKVAGMHFTDPIEVHLGYLTKLAELCRLPVQICTMLYPACARVTDDDIAAVTKKLSNTGTSSEESAANDRAYQHALAASELMRALLHRLQPTQMQAANTDTANLIE